MLLWFAWWIRAKTLYLIPTQRVGPAWSLHGPCNTNHCSQNMEAFATLFPTLKNPLHSVCFWVSYDPDSWAGPSCLAREGMGPVSKLSLSAGRLPGKSRAVGPCLLGFCKAGTKWGPNNSKGRSTCAASCVQCAIAVNQNVNLKLHLVCPSSRPRFSHTCWRDWIWGLGGGNAARMNKLASV